MYMKDIKLNMQGEEDTFIDLTKSVDNHSTLAQSCLALSVTAKGSDRLFPDKGTDLQAGVANINVINTIHTSHVANFAALDILSFLDNNTTYNQNQVEVANIDMVIMQASTYGESLKLAQKVYFTDGTFTNDVIDI